MPTSSPDLSPFDAFTCPERRSVSQRGLNRPVFLALKPVIPGSVLYKQEL
jgi:hypothetical protein